MDVGKILKERADELLVCATELQQKVVTFQQTADMAPVSDAIMLLTQLLVGLTGLGALVEQRSARDKTEAALERVHRMLDPQRRGDMT